MTNKVAVYGSLKQGFGNHVLLESSRFLGKDITDPDFVMYSLGWYPAICEATDNGTPIHIEVYEVTEHTFERLDCLEGYPEFYNRKIIETIYGDAWIYYIKENDFSDGSIVASGCWQESV